MKRFAFVGLGMVVGFIAALGLLPAARGANDMSAYRQLDLFSDAFERVRANYVRPVDDSELINAAIEGMVSNLDPHSSYMDAKAFADMQIQTKGSFGGIGIEVTMENGLVKIISPIDNTRQGRIAGWRLYRRDQRRRSSGLDLNAAIEDADPKQQDPLTSAHH
jgi:carboxyl-terminal processing protease